VKHYSDGYSRAQISLHWAIAILVLAVLFTHEDFLTAQATLLQGGHLTAGQVALRALHLWGGAIVLPLALWRTVVRLRDGGPAPPPREPRVLRVAASTTHLLLYVLIFVLPVSGVLVYYGVLPGVSGAIHRFGEPALFILVLAHVGASLVHHFYWKTDVLLRMLKPRQSASSGR
jgi:cytochrome b561